MSAEAAGRWLRRLVLLQVLVFGLLPLWSEPNAPLDVLQHVAWGRHPAWGYWKHPPLPVWVTTWSVDQLGVWSTFLWAQVLLLPIFWALWRLGREWLDPVSAALAAGAGEGLLYLTLRAPELNHDSFLLAAWPVVLLAVCLGAQRGQLRWWLLAGLVGGLGLLSKYTMALLLLSLLGWLLTTAAGRACWRTPGPWVAVGLCLLLFAPHLRWAQQHDWVTLRYVADRGASAAAAQAWGDLLLFCLTQLTLALPVWFILQPLLGRRRRPLPTLLLWAAVGPWVLTVLAGAAGLALKFRWGAPLLLPWPLLLLAGWGREPTSRACWHVRWRCVIALGCFAVGLIARDQVAPRLGQPLVRTLFAGQELARQVEQAWRQRYGTPLPQVGGVGYLTFCVALYGPSRATAYGDLEPRTAPWTDDATFRQQGGALLWFGDPPPRRFRPDQPPERIAAWRQRFPEMSTAERLEVPWHLPGAPSATVWLTLLPPAQDPLPR
ncbi:MAG: glycosyltransferase family 39 protein [Fimbriimonadaceae bacterium]|nr:glycosyltransferase family 39 protein [Fimbriimonadaceae bacterium]